MQTSKNRDVAAAFQGVPPLDASRLLAFNHHRPFSVLHFQLSTFNVQPPPAHHTPLVIRLPRTETRGHSPKGCRMTQQLTFNLMPDRKTWTVSELTAKIRDLLSKNFTDISVQGEISNCREAQSGHIYFTLKDDRAQVRCVYFKQQQRGIKFRPEDGLQVTVRGTISVYEQRGEYQIYVEKIEPVGLGALQLAFDQLKKRLEAEGLFDAARKRPLPLLPSRIGLITSPRGVAVRDVVRILTRRFPNVYLTVFPVRVQGEGAAQEVVKALKFFNAKKFVDVLILARGGESARPRTFLH